MNKLKSKRFIIQLIVLTIVIISSFNHYLSSIGKNIPWVSESLFHYICPVCGVTSIYQLFASQTLWVVKLKSTLGLVIGLVIILSVILGPIICGFICPFGAIQDIVARLGKKIFKNKYNNFIPKSLDKKLKNVRYITLLLTIILTASSGVMILESINPYHAFLGIFKNNISKIGFIILLIVITTSLFVQRPWCRYLCPYGALLGLSNKIKLFRIVRNNNTCVSCKKCSKSFPMGIAVHEKEEVRDLSCISCLECVNDKVCPIKNTITCSSEDLIDEYTIDKNIIRINETKIKQSNEIIVLEEFEYEK